MALTFDTSKVAEHIRKGRDGDPEARSLVTEAMIWATMATGIGLITEANEAEFYARISTYERMTGAMRGDDKGPIFFTPEDVHNHIGLETNVFSGGKSRDESRASWTKRIMERQLQDGIYSFHMAQRAKVDA